MLLRPTRSFLLDGREVTLAADLRALYRFHCRRGHHVWETSAEDESGQLSILWAMLQSHDPDVTEDQIGALGYVEFGSVLLQAYDLLRASSQSSRRESDGDASNSDGDASNEEAEFSWFEMWAFGRIDMRLPEAEFWSLTPVMFHHLCARIEDDREREWRMTGEICAAVGNIHWDGKAKPRFPEDYIPTRGGERARQERAMQHARHVNQKLRGLESMFPKAK